MTQMYSPYPQPQYQPPKKRKKWPWIVGGSVAAFVVIAAASAGGNGSQGQTTPYVSSPSPVIATSTPAPVVDLQIPEVAGKNGKIVMDELNNLGFTNVVSASQDVGDSLVILPENWTAVSVQPGVGTTVKSDSTVVVTMTKKKGAGAAPAPAAPAGPSNSFTDGTYEVGTDIEPGTYKTSGPGDSFFKNCYWARLKNTDGGFESIITNGNIQGPGTVTIKSSDGAFQATGGCEWVKK